MKTVKKLNLILIIIIIVTGSSGTLKMHYDSGPEMIANKLAPSTEPFVTKTFTVKGNNTSVLSLNYQIKIVVENNTFSTNAITYTLTGTNNAGNGNTIPNVTTRTGINSTKVIGTGNFSGKVTNAVHTYELKLYFYLTQNNQIDDLGKTFKAKLLLENLWPLNLTEGILAQGGGKEAIVANGIPNYANIATLVDTGLYVVPDDYGTSYYYRGLKDALNNNLIWGGFQWKIARINGDVSVRLL